MPTYSVITFGCQMNVHDSERMHGVMRQAGFIEDPNSETADVVVLNTCSVREKAEQKLRSEVGRLAVTKRKRGEMAIVVAGCVAQQEGERLIKHIPAIDVVIGPDNIRELPGLLAAVTTGAPPVARTVFDVDTPQFLSMDASVSQGRATGFVTTMKGCNERCSFCIVPYTRGPERYRPSHEIINEISSMVQNGVREVTLLGQTVNSYRDPSSALQRAPEADQNDPDESEFAALLRAIISQVPQLKRLRYTSPHPRHVTPSLIAAHRDLEPLAAHVHLPVQSGSDRVLKRMIRRYSRAEYVDRASRLRESRKGMTLSTDVIVGFPGETDEEALATVELIREMGFIGVFGFKYSQRPYTPAVKLIDDISEDEKGRRLARIFETSEALIQQHLLTLVDSTLRVLVEGASKTQDTLLSGRSERNEIVHFTNSTPFDLVGQLVDVHIERANKHSLAGTLIESSVTSTQRSTENNEPRRLRVLSG